jgi:hypothetical protein
VHQRSPNHIDNIVRPLEHFEIPKPYDPTPMRFRPFGSRNIAAYLGFIGMRFAIEFNNEARLGAEEIRNVGSNRRLAAKAKTSELLSA